LQFTRPKELDADYGTPLDFCTETSPGVFERKWTKADVSLDCNDFAAKIQMKTH
jgi:hypothetical protein